MWRATRITADAASKMQMNSGLLLNRFDITNPVAPLDADIICDTTGDYNITCKPETQDFFEDVNNAYTNMMEGKQITGWNCGLTITSLSVTEEALKFALGAADIQPDGGIRGRMLYRGADFQSVYWIGDMFDEDKLLCVVMDHTVSTGGVSLTTRNKGKGGLQLELTPHGSLADPETVPMAFYVLEKVDSEAAAYTYTAVTPASGDNPAEEGWYVLVGDGYRPTTDTTVDGNVTYYVRS